MRSVQLPLLVMLSSCTPLLAQSQESREFGKARFTVPAGFTAEESPTMQRFARVSGRDLCLIAVYSDEASPTSLDAAFANAWRSIFSAAAYRRADLPATTIATSPNGERYMTGGGPLEDRGGNRFVARLHLFPVATRTQSIVWIGNSDGAISGCRDAWGVFFGSLRFAARDVAGAKSEPPPANSTPSAATPAPNESTPTRVAAAGATERFDGVSFSPPAGWGVQRTRDAVILSPPNGRGSEWMRILVLRPKAASGGLAAESGASWREVQSLVGAQPMRSVNGKEFDVEGPLRSVRGWDFVSIEGGMRRPEGQHSAQLVAIDMGGRIARVAAFSRDFRDLANGGVMLTSLRNPAWNRAFRDLVATVKVDGTNEQTLPPARLTEQGIVGVWGGIAMSFGQLKTHHAIFFDNGTAFFGPRFPTQGLAEINPAASQLEYPRYWGRWSMSGGRGTLNMPYGVVPLRMDANSVVLRTNNTDHRFIRLYALPERMEGTFCLSTGPCLGFTAAGRFRDGGAVRALEHSVYSYAESPAGGEGRYRIAGFTIVLQYDDGTEIRLAIPGTQTPITSTPSTLTLGFNEDVLTRR